MLNDDTYCGIFSCQQYDMWLVICQHAYPVDEHNVYVQLIWPWVMIFMVVDFLISNMICN